MVDHIILDKAWNQASRNGWKIDKVNSHYGIIFNHDFAKAFFGDTVHDFKPYATQGHFDRDACKCGEEADNQHTLTCWEYHLQQMVLSLEPVKYLEKFIK